MKKSLTIVLCCGMYFGSILFASADIYTNTSAEDMNLGISYKSFNNVGYAPIIMGDIITFIKVESSTSGTGNNNSNTNTSSTIPVLSASEKQAYLDAINYVRGQEQDCGSRGIKPAVPALVWNDNLYKASWEHSNDLAKTNTFSHTGSGQATDVTAQVNSLGRGSNVGERIEHNGYTQWKAYGENIAAGTVMNQAQEAIDGWVGSPGHCANMMNPTFTEVGMAHVYDKNSYYSHYWTQNFGKR